MQALEHHRRDGRNAENDRQSYEERVGIQRVMGVPRDGVSARDFPGSVLEALLAA